jgi:hypothetical protein
LSFKDQIRSLLGRLAGPEEAEEAEKAKDVEESAQPSGASRTGPSSPSTTQAELDDADLATLAAVARCTACRACDVAFDAYPRAARPIFRGPSQLVLSYARRLEDHGAAKRYLESLRRGTLVELSRVCPVGVPFVALADLIERRAHALEPDGLASEDAQTRHDPG